MTEENETLKKVSLFNSDPYDLDKDNVYIQGNTVTNEWGYESIEQINLYEVDESPWTVGDITPYDLTSLSYAFGYGSLSAGHYDPAEKGVKYFGTLGQEIKVSDFEWGGMLDNWNFSNTTGQYHSAFTILPVVDQTAGEYVQQLQLHYYKSYEVPSDMTSYTSEASTCTLPEEYAYAAGATALKATAAAFLAIYLL